MYNKLEKNGIDDKAGVRIHNFSSNRQQSMDAQVRTQSAIYI